MRNWLLMLMICSLFGLPALSQEQRPSAAVTWAGPQVLSLATQLSESELTQTNLMLHSGQKAYPLRYAGRIKPESETGKRLPWLRGQAQLELQKFSGPEIAVLLRTVLKVTGTYQGKQTVSEQLQLAPILDQLLAYKGELGLSFKGKVPVFRLWAPTANQVRLLRYDNKAHKQLASLPMRYVSQGVWELSGQPDWYGSYYLYEVTVYSPLVGDRVVNRVTDPYSLSLAANSTHSQIISLDDAALKPAGWDQLLSTHGVQKDAPEDMVIYEMHLRDFSVADQTVPSQDRGRYKAFTHAQSKGMQHLRALAQSGLSHIHLLPVFDIATVEELSAKQVVPEIPKAPADSTVQQAVIGAVRGHDAYNWGYDPYHYGVTEGSYSSEPQGSARVLEFRQMVSSLAQSGLGSIMDVVYNHTHAAGQQPKSVLDKIVPGYYYRLDALGKIQQSTCCPDTATEHVMMEKLMIDTLLRWAKDYKITGFRFDLMGHHTLQNLRNVRTALDSLTLAKDGVDGKKIYLYGEGWKFGSLDARMPNQTMTQALSAGMGVGTFNDRLRDSARGGNFDHATRSDQGWLSGLYLDPNHSPSNTDTPKEPEAQKAQLLNYTDNIRLGMAGNLKNFVLTDAEGKAIKGSELKYRGGPGAGYTLDPQESINYVSAHDNYSLWDQIAAKAPYRTPGRLPETATAQERRDMQMLGVASVLLGQGVPFLDSGIEILRSKSGDGDSYDSGDYFNALDWTYMTNGWGKGLPAAWRNQKEWDFWRERLMDKELQAQQLEIQAALEQTKALLQIRRETPLLRLRSADQILKSVSFWPADSGLIAMHIDDNNHLDSSRKALLVLLNPAPEARLLKHALLQQNWIAFQIQGQPVLNQLTNQFRLAGDMLQLPPHAVLVLQIND